MPSQRPPVYSQLARLFLRLGLTAFGGPAAHIAMMQREVVDKRKWMDRQHFLDLLGATNLIPGPNSTEMAMHMGHEKAGWKGLIITGSCFILPAVCITGALAWLYASYGQLPAVQPFIYGIKPAIIAVILAAVFPLAKQSLKTMELGVLAVLTLALALYGMNEILLLFGAGLAGVLWSLAKTRSTNLLAPFGLLLISKPGMVAVSNVHLFLVFLKIGAILYGSGYVLFAFLDTELVQTGMLTRAQLTDAIAAGQITPGPVFSSVTFVGYQINGWTGAAWSTLAVFLPSFMFVALLNPLVKKMRGNVHLGVFLDAVNMASVALILAVCYFMGRESIMDWRTTVIALVSMGIVFGFKQINSAWIVLGGSLLGALLSNI